MTMDHSGHKVTHTPSGTTTSGAAGYTCPMHPEVKSATPGSCPKCGMALVPVAVAGEKAR